MLAHILGQEDYALSLAPGFCRFYAHIGVLDALHAADCLKVSHLTGCSAGALVAAFLSTGMEPPEMARRVLSIRRPDIWDMGGFGGLLKGNLFREKIAENLSVQEFESTRIPLSVTAFDLVGLKTNCLVSGDIAAATRASCTFPGLFQPIMIGGRPHIDGGVWDHDGLMALGVCFREGHRRAQRLPTKNMESVSLKDIVPEHKLIVNVTFDFLGFSKLPKELDHCRLLSIVVRNIPGVTPLDMEEMGVKAYEIAKRATEKAMSSAHIMELSNKHWCCYIDGDKGSIQLDEEVLSEKKTSLSMPPPLSCTSSAVNGESSPAITPRALQRASSLSSVSTVPYCELLQQQNNNANVSNISSSRSSSSSAAENNSSNSSDHSAAIVADLVGSDESSNHSSANDIDNGVAPTESSELVAESGKEEANVALLEEESREEGSESSGVDILIEIPSFSFLRGSYSVFESFLTTVASNTIEGQMVTGSGMKRKRSNNDVSGSIEGQSRESTGQKVSRTA